MASGSAALPSIIDRNTFLVLLTGMSNHKFWKEIQPLLQVDSWHSFEMGQGYAPDNSLLMQMLF